MKKKLILILLIIPLLKACSSWEELSLVHSPDIEQGNIITPEMVALLQPGMTQRQVRFALGSPMLIDVFHGTRWDYLLSIKRRNQAVEIKRFRVFFENDLLSHYQGDIKAAENVETKQEKRELVASVPDYDGDFGILERLWYSLGLGEQE
ncbi:MAG: outer membrane protein assembly factor BamE [Candidatus Thiodiazotropha lotti]|nr:outer membrane protein assembly factor BamE [Candidatus Thiodiazotropha lotti]MCG8005306.1 outer membrane protein assembly factor BamE [Candidatus Thiodiazotropha lotti]MCG8009826.1 outer membrane protein assembly factor BamE [Candidatus Thiodiazotropha lotti]MCW4188933.1 outer membrane protein assembly factor BamE [Candidatus Thiodiazotropha lotti]MCW4197420.1 outer membrane protein assembly factor BamE [Candidatus Thiodiazotropha lotti]